MTRNGENRCRIDMCIHVYIGNYEAICGRKFVWHASTIHGTIYAMDSSSLFASSAKDRKLIQKFEKERGRVNSKIEIDGVKRYINERFIVRDGTWKNKRLASNVNNYTVNGIAYFSAERRTTAIRGKPSPRPLRASTIRSDALGHRLEIYIDAFDDIPFFLHPSDGWNRMDGKGRKDGRNTVDRWSQLPMGAAMHHRLIDSGRITRSNVARVWQRVDLLFV